jgi:hypothetical protein
MNPNGETRMERLLEAYIQRNERAHENFEHEHKDLLTAQVVLSGHMDELSVKMTEVTDELNGLIGVRDDFIRRRGPG